jgi:hypothetical protein
MTNIVDSRLVTIGSATANEINDTYLSSASYYFTGLLQDETDIQYTQISIQSAQIPVSFYVINEYNNTLRYRIGNGTITNVSFTVGNYNASTFITEFKNALPSFNLSINKNTGRYTFSNNNNFTFYSSSIFKVLGFKKGLNYTSNNKVLDAPFPVNFLGITSVKIVSNTLSTYSMDSTKGNYSNTLATIPINTGAGGVILFENTSGYKPLLRAVTLNGFEIRLLDNDNNLINFNNVDWSMTLQLDITRTFRVVERGFNYPVYSGEDLEEEEKEPLEETENMEDELIEPNGIEELPYTEENDLDVLMYNQGVYI